MVQIDKITDRAIGGQKAKADLMNNVITTVNSLIDLHDNDNVGSGDLSPYGFPTLFDAVEGILQRLMVLDESELLLNEGTPLLLNSGDELLARSWKWKDI